MTDFAAARRMMVDGQVRTSDVHDPRLIAAMLDIPRERFVPPAKAGLAYLDLDLPVGEARCLLKPMVLAKLIQAAAVGAADHVLDVGCASGYSSAVLGRLARSVVALDEDAALLRTAEDHLRARGAENVTAVQGRLADGWSAAAPYDVIVVEGAMEQVPQCLLRQLKEGGRLLGVVGAGPASKAMLYLAGDREVSGRAIFDATAAPLPGFAAPRAFVF